jgi:ankyrin repeat protein
MPSRTKRKLSKAATAFMEACWGGRLKELSSLVRPSFDLDVQDSHVLPLAREKPFHDTRLTGLMYAAFGGHTDVVNFLLSKGADVSVQSKLRNTALGFAGALGRTEIVRQLLSHGADPNDIFISFVPLSILNLACINGFLDTAKALIEHGAKVNAGKFGHPLRSAAEAGHLEVVRELLKAGANPNPPNDKPLIVAAARGRQKVVRQLLSAGADINCIGDFGFNPIKGTPLMWAARHGHIAAVKVLVAANANLETLSNDWGEGKFNALGLAENYGHSGSRSETSGRHPHEGSKAIQTAGA